MKSHIPHLVSVIVLVLIDFLTIAALIAIVRNRLSLRRDGDVRREFGVEQENLWEEIIEFCERGR